MCYKSPPLPSARQRCCFTGAVYLNRAADDEETLIARCLAGEADAFGPLVERYHRPLFRMAVRLLGDREEARDATQSAFLKAYQALASCDTQRPFFTWIYRILINECLNSRRGRRPTQPMPDLAAASVPDAVDASETRRAVRQALLQLPAEQRDVIVLRHFGELSYEEVAAAAGIPVKTVKSRLFSARQRLCELLAGARI
jgi:RNA polymerase sigma-70 factor, ECF subfamily